jgi:hypothetical protein
LDAIAAAIRAAVAAEQKRLEAVYKTARAMFDQKWEAFGETCEEVAAAVRAARAAEREACALVCERVAAEWQDYDDIGRKAAAAIRSRPA